MSGTGTPRRAPCVASLARRRRPAPIGSPPEPSNAVRAPQIGAAPGEAIVVRSDVSAAPLNTKRDCSFVPFDVFHAFVFSGLECGTWTEPQKRRQELPARPRHAKAE